MGDKSETRGPKYKQRGAPKQKSARETMKKERELRCRSQGRDETWPGRLRGWQAARMETEMGMALGMRSRVALATRGGRARYAMLPSTIASFEVVRRASTRRGDARSLVEAGGRMRQAKARNEMRCALQEPLAARPRLALLHELQSKLVFAIIGNNSYPFYSSSAPSLLFVLRRPPQLGSSSHPSSSSSCSLLGAQQHEYSRLARVRTSLALYKRAVPQVLLYVAWRALLGLEPSTRGRLAARYWRDLYA